MTRGCIRRGSCLSICFRVEDVKANYDHSILTSHTILFLCWIKSRQHKHNHFGHTSTTQGGKSLKELAMIMNRKKT